MNLTLLLTELELLYRSEIRFGISARKTVGQLVIDYLYSTFIDAEPPIPIYPAYVWPKHEVTYSD